MLKMLSKKKIKLCIDSLYLYKAANNRLASTSYKDSETNSATAWRLHTFFTNAIKNNPGEKDEHLIPLMLDAEFLEILHTAIMINFTAASLINGICPKTEYCLECLAKDITNLMIENSLEVAKNENMQ